MHAASDGAGPRRWLRVVALLLLISPACGDDAVSPEMTCDLGTVLPLDQTVVERLDGDDSILDGVPIDYFAVQAATPGVVTVEMASARIDPFLVFWTDDHLVPAAQAFDTDGTGLVLRARLEVPVDAGCHLVGATAWRAGAEGEYTVRAELRPEH